MTEPVLIRIACVVAAVVAYGLLRLRLMRATHEFRVRAGCEADDWAQDPRVSPDVRATLRALADMAYRPAAPWLVLLGLSVVMILPPRKLSDIRISDDAAVATKIVLLKLKLLFALIATSPLVCVLAGVVLMIGLLVHSSVRAVRDNMSVAGDRFFPGTRAEYPRSA